MSSDILSKRCPYCRGEKSVTGMSARTIPGYKNPITGKDTAMVEKLSCGHEFVDGKFNVDSLYHSNPTPTSPIQEESVVTPPAVSIHHHHNYKQSKRKSRITIMDILCVGCTGVLAVAFPPLVVVPILYFLFRMSSE